jgi:ABC-type polysaccharide/polyol phosphate transport system ATPase subunit
LDEIFAGGDASFMMKAKKRMHDMIHRSNIMVMVSHDSDLIRKLCNRVIMLDHGKLVADGPSNLILQRYLSGN